MNTPIQNPFIPPRSTDDKSSVSFDDLNQHVRVGMIITFALVQGVIIIAAIFWLMSDGDAEQAAADRRVAEGSIDQVMFIVGLVATSVSAILAFVMVKTMRAAAITKFRASGETIELPIRADTKLQGSAAALLSASYAWTLVGQALLEGAAVMNLVLMYLDGNMLHLGLAAIGLIGIVMLTPTMGKKTTLLGEAVAG